MTRIAERKTRFRGETSSISRGRPLVISAEAHEVVIRQKGRKIAYAVPWLAVWELGQKLAALEARRLKFDKRGKR